MSLDVYLEIAQPKANSGSGIFVREAGQTREITRAEWDERFPGAEPVVAVICGESHEVYSANVTHNLGKMADEAGIYRELWRPEELDILLARELIEPLQAGVQRLRADPERYRKFNPPNGWGSYDMFVPWVERYLAACRLNPTATVRVCR